MKQHWKQLKEKGIREQVCAYIDNLYAMLRESDEINSAMWPITHATNGDTYLGFKDAVERLKSTFNNKYMWLDEAINNL